eukprot:1345426-Pyramimonas_sp.AAC.1
MAPPSSFRTSWERCSWKPASPWTAPPGVTRANRAHFSQLCVVSTAYQRPTHDGGKSNARAFPDQALRTRPEESRRWWAS